MVRSSSPPTAANDHRSGFGTRQEVAAYLKVPERPSTSGLQRHWSPFHARWQVLEVSLGRRRELD
jgi:hypothetical protein